MGQCSCVNGDAGFGSVQGSASFQCCCVLFQVTEDSGCPDTHSHQPEIKWWPCPDLVWLTSESLKNPGIWIKGEDARDLIIIGQILPLSDSCMEYADITHFELLPGPETCSALFVV
ncbi:hypothetical protein chiPu_0020842 [Chiloscyllium punctatum]|uniref:Uncharacterized protein n=1 Tax=Chiloscyllium punctatum TaxID=137246 RepID=A0A401RKB3_CHIPU|nr:hypothetical protein [Chiloscyllium punctatum]